MRSEQLLLSKAINTLVELEYIQQSMDFQELQDKNSVSLLGINETSLSLSDLVKSTSKRSIARASKGAKDLAVLLSDECVNCGDQRMKDKLPIAFKMACLHY